MTKIRKKTDKFSGPAMESDLKTDLLIIGGGPAGLSAALWGCELGLNTVLVNEAAEFGGQLLLIHNPIRNYLGVEAKNGRALRDVFVEAVEEQEFARLSAVRVVSLDAASKTANLSDGRRVGARAVVIATGVRRRKLGVAGEDEFIGNGILESGAGERSKVKGERVLIVGGGDAALENALILAEYAESVTIVHRRSQFRAREEFLRPALGNPRIELITDSEVTRIIGAGRVEHVEIANRGSGERLLVAADKVLIRIGVEPNSEFVRGQIELDDRSYIAVDRECRTSIEGIFAAGDVANPVAPTISSAVGSGATSVKAAFELISDPTP